MPLSYVRALQQWQRSSEVGAVTRGVLEESTQRCDPWNPCGLSLNTSSRIMTHFVTMRYLHLGAKLRQCQVRESVTRSRTRAEATLTSWEPQCRMDFDVSLSSHCCLEMERRRATCIFTSPTAAFHSERHEFSALTFLLSYLQTRLSTSRHALLRVVLFYCSNACG